MNPVDLFHKLALPYQQLDGNLDAGTADEFADEFRELFSQDSARKAIKVVYVWSTQKPIPRLSGASNVIYIGQTTKSLFERHARYADTEFGGGNWQRYHHIIKTFGPIAVQYAECENPKEAESSFLRWYFEDHLEPPPLNSMSS